MEGRVEGSIFCGLFFRRGGFFDFIRERVFGGFFLWVLGEAVIFLGFVVFI